MFQQRLSRPWLVHAPLFNRLLAGILVRYAELSIPFVNKVGGVPMWRGNFGLVLIGPDEARWDEILIMQYPARSAFESMLADPDYQAIVFHRTAAIKDSRLFGATSPEAIGPMKWKIFNISQKLRGR